MKTTLRQLENTCTGLNTGALKETWFGVFAERDGADVSICVKGRKAEDRFSDSVFTGTVKECDCFLQGLTMAVDLLGHVQNQNLIKALVDLVGVITLDSDQEYSICSENSDVVERAQQLACGYDAQEVAAPEGTVFSVVGVENVVALAA